MSIFDTIDPFADLSLFGDEARSKQNEMLSEVRYWRELRESVEAKLLELREEPPSVPLPVVVSDLIIGRIVAVAPDADGFNAKYDVESVALDSGGNPVLSLVEMEPINRMFAPSDVDFLPSPVSVEGDKGESMAKIYRYQEPGEALDPGFGACVILGICAITGDGSACEAAGGAFVLGYRCPGYVVEITEKVKTRTCLTPKSVLSPPPVITQVAGVLN